MSDEREMLLRENAAVSAIARVITNTPTMTVSDIRIIARTAYALGYERAKQERLADIELFKNYDEDENVQNIMDR